MSSYKTLGGEKAFMAGVNEFYESRNRRIKRLVHKNVLEAIRDAQADATSFGIPQGVAYIKGDGWQAYELINGTDGEPEFVCFGQGKVPHGLTETAIDVWCSLLRSLRTEGIITN